LFAKKGEFIFVYKSFGLRNKEFLKSLLLRIKR